MIFGNGYRQIPVISRIFSPKQSAKSESIRGVWIANQPHSQFLTSAESIQRGIRKLLEEDVNIIFPVVWTRGYTLYPSQVMTTYGFPEIAPFYQQQNRDPLAEVIAEAKKYDLKVVPWFEYGFAASHLRHGGHLIEQYPHWQGMDYQGSSLIHGGLNWMNSFHPEVQQFMQRLILEVLQRYDVAGFQGCDRLPAAPVQGGYDEYTLKQYQSEFEQLPPTNYRDIRWLKWRSDLLTEFLADLVQKVKASKPQAIVSLSPAVYPFCRDNLLQDTKTWVEQELGDWIHPQIYRSDFRRYRYEVDQIKKQFAPQYWRKFAPGIALKANQKFLSDRDLTKCRQLNRKAGFAGEVIFHY